MTFNITMKNSLLALAMASLACGLQAKPLPEIKASIGHGEKVGAAVTVELTSGSTTSKNAILPVMLRFTTDQPNTPLHVEYRSNAGLSIVTLGSAILVSNQDGVVTDTPNVRATADGVYELNVFVTLGDRTKAVSVPVTVGNARAVRKLSGKAMRTPQGENLTVMPAQEKVR
ncbi:MAG: hypothetical protein ABI171_17575 [Collimonas sp.]|uniref:hypothetical protein n=1 Tax=Collimonas sp. TaxID=1963772 RepID=UPI003266F1D7